MYSKVSTIVAEVRAVAGGLRVTNYKTTNSQKKTAENVSSDTI